jgi:hypothetical protein
MWIMGVRSDRVAAPSLRVFVRVIHPEWFGVRRSRRLTHAGWEADVRLIDGGHLVTWGSGRTRMTEVLVGPEAPLPTSGLVFHAAPRGERSTTLRPRPGVEYQVCYSVERVDAEVFRHISEELLVDPKPGMLFWRAPAPDRITPPSTSRLQIEAYERRLLVHAFHTVPEFRAVVRTQSLIELSDVAS